MIIYIVTKGEYSDYHIIAATLDKDKAEKIAKMHTSNIGTEFEKKAMVEEFDDNIENCLPWFDIYCKKGKITECKMVSEYPIFEYEKEFQCLNGN
ncbi:MAG: hypothetical protein IKU25_09345, partial [Clostridia bacterium]|nr:hypothetical protein [Clostridia bacterium]